MATLLEQLFAQPGSAQALGLLGASISAGDAPAGFASAINTMAAQPDIQLKRQMMVEDLAMKRLAEQRAQAQWKMQQDAYAGIGMDGASGGIGGGISPSGISSPGAFVPSAGGGPVAPISQLQGQPDQGQINAAQLRRLEGMAIAGVPGAKEALDIFKYKNTPQTVNAGGYSRNAVTGELTYNEDPTKGIRYQNGVASQIPGAANALAGIAGAQTSAQEAAKDRYAPLVPVNAPSGPRLMTAAQARAYATGQASPQAPAPQAPSLQPSPSMPQRGTPQLIAGAGDLANTIQGLQSVLADAKPGSALYQRTLIDIGNAQKELGKMPGGNLPGGALQSEADKAAQIKRAEGTVAQEQSQRTALAPETGAYYNSINGLDRLSNAAAALAVHPGLKGIFGLRGAVPNIPGSDAADAQALLATLKSQVGFGVLQDMRNNSKSGGALGAVSDRENDMLQSNLAALDKAQSVEQAVKSLQQIADYATGAQGRLTNVFKLQQRDDPEFTAPADPKGKTVVGPAGQPAANVVDALPKNAPIGTRARDTQTGKIMRFNGLGWSEAK